MSQLGIIKNINKINFASDASSLPDSFHYFHYQYRLVMVHGGFEPSRDEKQKNG